VTSRELIGYHKHGHDGLGERMGQGAYPFESFPALLWWCGPYARARIISATRCGYTFQSQMSFTRDL
jgi:hypothetical protein